MAYSLLAFLLGYGVFIALSPVYLINPYLSTALSFIVLWYLYDRIEVIDVLEAKILGVRKAKA